MIALVALLLAMPPTWHSDWKEAFALAKQEHRLVFVIYTQTEARCGVQCYHVKQSLELQRTAERMADFVLLRVDPDVNWIPGARKYETPAVVIFDWGERERFRASGRERFHADDWHETWGEHNPMNYPLLGPLDRFRSEAPAFVKAAELLDEKKDADAARVLEEAYERLHMTAHARAAAKLVKNFSSP